jgi:hypothetical protein
MRPETLGQLGDDATRLAIRATTGYGAIEGALITSAPRPAGGVNVSDGVRWVPRHKAGLGIRNPYRFVPISARGKTAEVRRIVEMVFAQGRPANAWPADVRNWDAEIISSAKGHMSLVSPGPR